MLVNCKSLEKPAQFEEAKTSFWGGRGLYLSRRPRLSRAASDPNRPIRQSPTIDCDSETETPVKILIFRRIVPSWLTVFLNV